MLNSGLIGPPVAAKSWHIILSAFIPAMKEVNAVESIYSLGHRQAKSVAMPKQKTSHCSDKNWRYLFRGFATFFPVVFGFLSRLWSFSGSSGGNVTVTTI